MSKGRRAGFTLVELLMVALLSSLVVAAAYSVLITSQRTYTVERVKIRSSQVLRAGMDVLAAELREISPEEGDILTMDEDSITVRVSRSFGIVCSVSSYKPPYNAAVLKIGGGFAGADSVFIFADNDFEVYQGELPALAVPVPPAELAQVTLLTPTLSEAVPDTSTDPVPVS